MAAIRLSGTLVNRPAPNAAVGAFYFATDVGLVFQSDGISWLSRDVLNPADVVGTMSGLLAERPPSYQAVGWLYRATDNGQTYEAFSDDWYSAELTAAADALVSQLKGPGLSELANYLGAHFSARFQSTGDAADLKETRVLIQTVGASQENPYLIQFNQYILTEFTGSGQFDLVERDASDIDVFDDEGELVSGGESEVIIATKDGFTDEDTGGGWSKIAVVRGGGAAKGVAYKAITTDKVYSIVFVPGDTGDGIYTAQARAAVS